MHRTETGRSGSSVVWYTLSQASCPRTQVKKVTKLKLSAYRPSPSPAPARPQWVWRVFCARSWKLSHGFDCATALRQLDTLKFKFMGLMNEPNVVIKTARYFTISQRLYVSGDGIILCTRGKSLSESCTADSQRQKLCNFKDLPFKPRGKCLLDQRHSIDFKENYL